METMASKGIMAATTITGIMEVTEPERGSPNIPMINAISHASPMGKAQKHSPHARRVSNLTIGIRTRNAFMMSYEH